MLSAVKNSKHTQQERKMFRSLLAASVACLVGCGIFSFDVEGNIGEQSVQGDPLGSILDAFALEPIPVQIDVNAALNAQNVSVIQGIFLKEITLQISATDNQNGDDNFDFIDQIEMFASSENNPNLPRVLVAQVTHEEDGATTLVIPGEAGVNLKDYVEAGMNIETEVTGSAPLTDTSFDGVVVVTIDAL
jgi:hypothetical protein